VVVYPPVLAYPAAVLLVWIALAVLFRSIRLRRQRNQARSRSTKSSEDNPH
jgi:hypothetical protein